jgi:pyruvate/2-oxoglutarate dehydrogenase complex dihydrolipoamide dehydrogenase (E3) component
VPSKSLLRPAHAVGALREAARLGVTAGEPAIDFPAIMRRGRAVRADISPHDSAQRYTDMGVDVFFGDARFTGPELVEVGGRTLRFARAIIATGSRPLVPPIAGLQEAGYLTNETIFELTEQPARMAIIGAGPIGCELAQAFQRLGTQVTLIDIAERVLGQEEDEASRLVQRALEQDGVALRLGSEVIRVQHRGGAKQLILKTGTGETTVAADEILVAVGRTPNVGALNLSAAGVDQDGTGKLVVSESLQTTNENIFASGDVAVPYQFTHVAERGRMKSWGPRSSGRTRATSSRN